jgi:hypothetical protein
MKDKQFDLGTKMQENSSIKQLSYRKGVLRIVRLIVNPDFQYKDRWDISSLTLKLLVLVTIITEKFQVNKPIRLNAFYRQLKETWGTNVCPLEWQKSIVV